MNALDHPLIQDYLRRLHDETVRLGVPEGRELETQIGEHLVEALGPDPSETQVREALDRLGDPAELVDEAGGAPRPTATATGASPLSSTPPHSAWREIGALACLVGAALLFWLFPLNILLWLGGLVLLTLATRWTVAEKLWGALVLGLSGWVPVVLAGAAFVVVEQTCTTDASGARSCTGGEEGLSALNIVAIVFTVVWLLLYLWTLVRLARSAARAR